jgi:hypothetical protein
MAGATRTITAAGPLAVSRDNPRYFAVGSDRRRLVYLTGSHINNNFHDGLGFGRKCSTPPEPSDFESYLDFLSEHGHNFIRLWRWEHFRSLLAMMLVKIHFCMTPQPWPRTGPGAATDGKPKFDLSRFDPEYFDRLRGRVIAAGQRGVYVSVMLFDGFGLHLSVPPDNIEGHPFHGANNINGIGIKSIVEYMVLPLDARVQEVQIAYIEKVLDTLHDLPNVLYEVANESPGGGAPNPALVKKLKLAESADELEWGDSTAWQYWVIDRVREHEARKTYPRHPIGMTMQYPVPDTARANDALFESEADWISPGGGASPFDDRTFARQWLEDPPANDGRKVIITDTDHYAPGKGDALWVWKSFVRGHNPILFDPGIARGAKPAHPSIGMPPYRKFASARYAMGDTRRLAERVHLAAMRPMDDCSSTGYALVNPGVEYVVLQPGKRRSFTVSLTAGTYSVEWYDVGGRETERGDPLALETDGPAKLKAPFAGPAVLYLKRMPGSASR